MQEGDRSDTMLVDGQMTLEESRKRVTEEEEGTRGEVLQEVK